MGITYEDAIKAKKEIRAKLLADPNIVSVGVIAETDEMGKPTGDYSIQVGVVSLEIYSRAQRHGQSVIPEEFILPPDDQSSIKRHVHIHVIKEGKIEALTHFCESKENDLPDATDDFPQNIKSTVNHTMKRRPSPCGQSIGHPDTTAGTLGLLVEYTTGPNTGKAYILSNNHVIASNNLAFVNDPIIQPGKHDSGIVGRDTIAYLHRWVPLKISDLNYVDCAIAEVKGGAEWTRYASAYITHIGEPKDLTGSKDGMKVEKVGRTTGRTIGEIISSSVDININFPIGRLTFADQISTTNMSKAGDSGSCLIEQGTKRPVGLLFAGSNSATYHNPIQTVLSEISLEHINKYPSGKTHIFTSDHPLQILQKRTYSTSIPRIFMHNTLKHIRPLQTKCASIIGLGICVIATEKILGLKNPLTKVLYPFSLFNIGTRKTQAHVNKIEYK
jgi:hypothetical protein